MTERMIAEIFHARLHANKDLLSRPDKPFTFEDWVAHNRKALNDVSKKFFEDYGINVPRSILDMGIRRFLIAEHTPIQPSHQSGGDFQIPS